MIVGLALVLSLAGGPSTPPCGDIDWRAGVAQREALIECLIVRFPRLGREAYSTALSVARCESGPNLDPRAILGTSSGMWQHQMPYWRARAMKYLSNPRWGLDPRRVMPWDAYAATVVTFSMVSDRDIGWGPWSCA